MDFFWEVMDYMIDFDFGMVFFSDQYVWYQKYMGSKVYWYLVFIVICFEYKGFGVGWLLMEWGVMMVDEGSYEVYFEVLFVGKLLFEKYGFYVEKVVEYLEGRYVECFMIWDVMKIE